MDLIARNKELMKKFEIMINTADVEIAEELVASDAPFYTPASPKPLYGARVIYQLFIGGEKVLY